MQRLFSSVPESGWLKQGMMLLRRRDAGQGGDVFAKT
jgi:hypothetical protein